MKLKSFLKEIFGLKTPSERKTRQEDNIITNNHQQSTVINSNQHLSTETYSKRDLQYARRMGQMEQMAADVSDIKDKLTGLDVKFDLRVPDIILTEDRFEKEVSENTDIFTELSKIKESVEKLHNIITNNHQQSTVEILEKPKEKISMGSHEDNILEQLRTERLDAKELGKRIGLSRSRTNQILLGMENKKLILRIKYGKKYLWAPQNEMN